MKKPIEEILDICLEKVAQGVPIDEVLEQYPDYKDQLKHLLAIATDIKDAPVPTVSDRAVASCLIKMGKAIQLQKEKTRRVKLPRISYFPSPAWIRGLVFVLILIFISWSTASLSAYSLPGDLLYPVKLVTEKVKYFLTINSEGKAELRITYSEERTKELVKHLNKKGELNTQLLKAMLDEAALALANVSRLPEDKETVYLSKLEHLNAYQKDILEGLKSKVPQPQQEELDNAIQMCGYRGQWMRKMRKGEVPRGSWDPCCNW